MRRTSLYPDDPEPILHPGPPRIYLRRLVIVRDRRVGGERIQNIPFRLGLNIIDTPESPREETRTVGHNVGKTLLVRLIRYCLGDRNYANKAIRFHLHGRFPNAYVLAEIVVAGTNWLVARPFARGQPSWALIGNGWESLLGDPAEFSDYDDFSRAVEAATVESTSSVELPHIGRTIQWTDILGWLARDQHCRFRHHNDWREPEMDAGPPSLKFEDANLITRAVMGVLDLEELRRSAKLEKLRSQRKKADENSVALRQRIEHTRSHLMRRLDLSSDAPTGLLFANGVRQKLEAMRGDVEKELRAIVTEADLERFEAERLKAEREVGNAEGRAGSLTDRREWIEAQLAQAEDGKRSSQVASFAQLAKCEHPECPLGKADRPPGMVDPIVLSRIADLQEQLSDVRLEHTKQTTAVEKLKKAERLAADQLARRRADYAQSIKGLQTRMGQFEVLDEQVSEYGSDVDDHEREIKECDRLDGLIAKAQEERGDLIARHAFHFGKLNECFQRVLHQLLPDAKGKLLLDNKVGLAPKTDVATGEALGTAGKVVGFDLACLLTAVCGSGSHPRFLIHDSPREADLELTAYYRLFQWAVDLENSFSGEPPFQYVITTTTPPPRELAEKYVCLTLDARREDGFLLREKFDLESP